MIIDVAAPVEASAGNNPLLRLLHKRPSLLLAVSAAPTSTAATKPQHSSTGDHATMATPVSSLQVVASHAMRKIAFNALRRDSEKLPHTIPGEGASQPDEQEDTKALPSLPNQASDGTSSASSDEGEVAGDGAQVPSARRSARRKGAYAVHGLRRINSFSSIYSMDAPSDIGTVARRPPSPAASADGSDDDEPLGELIDSEKLERYRQQFSHGSLVRIRVHNMVNARFSKRQAKRTASPEDLLKSHALPDPDALTDSEGEDGRAQPTTEKAPKGETTQAIQSEDTSHSNAIHNTMESTDRDQSMESSPVDESPGKLPGKTALSTEQDLPKPSILQQPPNDNNTIPTAASDIGRQPARPVPYRRPSRAHDMLVETYSGLVSELASLLPGGTTTVRTELRRNSVMNLDLLLAQFDALRAATRGADTTTTMDTDEGDGAGVGADSVEDDGVVRGRDSDDGDVSGNHSVPGRRRRRPAPSLVLSDRPEVVEVEFARENDRTVTLRRGARHVVATVADASTATAATAAAGPDVSISAPNESESATTTDDAPVGGEEYGTIVEEFVFEHWVPDSDPQA
ncbi:hypothetical protein HK405_004077, partial [Cladochytrium tenue]